MTKDANKDSGRFSDNFIGKVTKAVGTVVEPKKAPPVRTPAKKDATEQQ